ncbi:MAG: hypothetical protein P4K83_07945 [Terracidiphilus sp.]|nr:hypothetical protein [Terracidiphilus sp.]
MKEFREVASLKRRIAKMLGKRPGARFSPEKAEERRQLDEVLLAMRAARRTMTKANRLVKQGNWLRMVRQAIGMPAKEVARQLGINKWGVFRLEKAERSSSIQLASLKRTAEALSCDLVYALVPREGSLEDLATKQKQAVEEERERTRIHNKKQEEVVGEVLGWEEVWARTIRGELRKKGIRIR